MGSFSIPRILQRFWPQSKDSEETSIDHVGFQEISDTYTKLSQRAEQAREVADIRATIKRLVQLDSRVIILNRHSLRQVSETVAKILSTRDKDIQRILTAIAEVDEALSNPDGKEAQSADEMTRASLEQAHQMLLRDKARAIMYLNIILEVYRIIHEARTERQKKVNEIETKLQALEAAEDRARRAHTLIDEVLETARLDRQELEGSIAKVSPQLLQLVTQTADLNADLIIKGADFMHRAHGTVEEADSLDLALNDIGEAIALPDLVADRLSQVENISTLGPLVDGEKAISADMIADFQAKLDKAVSGALKDSWDHPTPLPETKLKTIPTKASTKTIPQATSRFAECQGIHTHMGNTPQAAQHITTIVLQDHHLSPNELAWIQSEFGEFTNVREALIAHPQLTEPTLITIFHRYAGAIPPHVSKKGLASPAVGANFLVQLLKEANEDSLSVEIILLAMHHSAGTTAVRNQLNSDKLLQVLVNGNAHSKLVPLMFGSGLPVEFQIKIFQRLNILYPSTSDNLVEVPDIGHCYTKEPARSSINAYTSNGDSLYDSMNHFFSVAEAYCRYCQTTTKKGVGVNIAVIDIVISWMESLPQVIVDGDYTFFGFRDRKRGTDWVDYGNQRNRKLTSAPFIGQALKDHHLPKAKVDKLLNALPNGNYNPIHLLALRHPNNTDARLSRTYKSTNLTKQEAMALAENPNLTTSGLAFILELCDAKHQMMIINHQNADMHILTTLEYRGVNQAVILAAIKRKREL